jgi:hypothetical protein
MIIYIGGDTAQEQTKNCRLVIKSFLQDSDWTQIPNNPLTPEYSAEWAVYRQELRDFMRLGHQVTKPTCQTRHCYENACHRRRSRHRAYVRRHLMHRQNPRQLRNQT